MTQTQALVTTGIKAAVLGMAPESQSKTVRHRGWAVTQTLYTVSIYKSLYIDFKGHFMEWVLN